MQLFIEAGVFSWGALVVFGIGLVVCVKSTTDPRTTASVFAGIIVALGLLGAGMGQRFVDGAVQNVTSLDERVLILSMGTKEAAANHVIAGALAGLLLLVAVGIALSRRTPAR